MKKKTFFFIVVACSSFTILAYSPNKHQLEKKHPPGTRWFDFNGTSAVQMSLNFYYTADPNNSPDCPIMAGTIYCEILATDDAESDPEDPKPDLSTISNYRMKP